MAGRKILIVLATICLTYAEVKLITEPKPGQEYVFLQTSGAGSRPIERKEKATENERVFETAHKLPPSLTYSLNKADAEAVKPLKPLKKVKREALPADAPAPAPAGAIKLDPLKLIEKYKTVLKTSTTAAPARTTRRTTKIPKRSKKDIHGENVVAATSPSPAVLTTGAPAAKIIDDDVPLVAAGSEKQRSRIQVKKGPNGQEYEYEYVYYYYDDDEDEKKDGKKASNSHDGPARNEVTQKPTRGRGTTAAPEAAVNEVLPTSRGRGRGRQLAEEETVGEERLPANTRFPPRSKNLNTTPLPEEEEEAKPTRSRSRGKPSNDVAPESDSVSDETQGSRGRTRANVRRPSLELVDSASFNTHSSGGEPPNGSGGPSFPSDLPAGPVRFLGATPNEQPDEEEEEVVAEKEEEETPESEAEVATDENGAEATTMMSPMDKVALDLYAILQGTQRLSGEEEVNTEGESTDATDAETTTLEVTTEELTTEEPTTTTTTTTTTPAPTTTTTTTTAAPEPAFGRGRYRNRVGGKKSSQSTTTTEASHESKPKGSKFERPRFGGARPRPGGRTTAAPGDDEPKATKEESKPVSGGRTRTRFGAPRTRTTAAPSETSSGDDSSSVASAAPAKPSARPRPAFNLRTRTRTTAAPSTEGGEEPAGGEESSAPASSTTARSRPRISAGSGSVRPLRPGPRINLSGRPRLGAAAAPSTEAPVETSAPAEEEETSKTEEGEEKEPEPSPAPDTNPLNRLRNRQRPQVQVKPKAAASAPVQVRRVNPLLARRKPGQPEPTSEAPAEAQSTEAAEDDEEDEETDAPAPSSTSTTEEPRGLNKLLAGRRRLGSRQPGTLA